jgi:hypothetical protein
MKDNTCPTGLQQRVRSGLQRDVLGNNIHVKIALLCNGNVSKIARMRSGGIEFAMLFAAWIEVLSSRFEIRGLTAACVMNMNRMFAGREILESTGNAHYWFLQELPSRAPLLWRSLSLPALILSNPFFLELQSRVRERA